MAHFGINPGMEPAMSTRRMAAVGVILALHMGFWMVMKSGMMTQAIKPIWSHPIFTTVVPPPPKQEPPPTIQPRLMKELPVAEVRPVPFEVEPSISVTPVAHAAVTKSDPTPAPVAAAPSPGIVSNGPPQPKTITTGVEYLQAPQPDYPQIAKRMGEHGKVMLRVLVDERGHAERADVTQSSGSDRLDQAARVAVLHSLFKPYMEDGKAVAVIAIVPIVFELG